MFTSKNIHVADLLRRSVDVSISKVIADSEMHVCTRDRMKVSFLPLLIGQGSSPTRSWARGKPF
jgi:hypothetical protein